MSTRGEHLRLLAGLLAAPGEESLAALGTLDVCLPWLEPARRELAGIALDEWRAEHTRLFINGFPRTPCLPFESAQLEGLMPGPSTEAVNALYRKLGLEIDEVFPDYLGAMLECAAYLTESEPRLDVEEILWRDHLSRWLPAYGENLQAESRLALYRGLGHELAALSRECGHG